MAGSLGQCGPYQLRELLARGGFGAVYRASDPSGREVALKLLQAGRADSAARRRFQREAEALGRLRHPGVVAVHAAGEDAEGRPFLVMDLIRGRTLEDRLRREGPLEPAAAVRMAARLADALEHVHAQGVLHRDLKPDNVLLGPDDEPQLTDFGLARDLDPSLDGTKLTQDGRFLGTPGYWPPEQARGQVDLIGPRSDVYGLGAVLYATLTGRPPQEGESLPALVLAATRPPQPPSRHRPGLAPALDAVCLRALAPEPDQRYPDVAALRADLERHLQGASVEALRLRRRAAQASALRRVGVGLLVLLPLAVVALATRPGGPSQPAPPPPATQAPVGSVPPPRPAAESRWVLLNAEALRARALPGLEVDHPWGIDLHEGAIRFRALGGAIGCLRLPLPPLPPTWRLSARVRIVHLDGGSFGFGLGDAVSLSRGVQLSARGEREGPSRGLVVALDGEAAGERAKPSGPPLTGPWGDGPLQISCEALPDDRLRVEVRSGDRVLHQVAGSTRGGAAGSYLLVGTDLPPRPNADVGSWLDVRLESLELWAAGEAAPLPGPEELPDRDRALARALLAIPAGGDLRAAADDFDRRATFPPPPGEDGGPSVYEFFARSLLEARLGDRRTATSRLATMLTLLREDPPRQAQLLRLRRRYLFALAPLERGALADLTGAEYEATRLELHADQLRTGVEVLEGTARDGPDAWGDLAALLTLGWDALGARVPYHAALVAFRVGWNEDALRWLEPLLGRDLKAQALAAHAALRLGLTARARELCAARLDEAKGEEEDRVRLRQARGYLAAREAD